MSTTDETGIRETMAAYNAALNGGKTAAVLPLYTDDGVFMPPYSQSAVGKSAVTTAYDKVFDELKTRSEVRHRRDHSHWTGLGVRRYQLDRYDAPSFDRRDNVRSQPGTFCPQERRRRQVANCALQFFADKCTTFLRGTC